METSLIDIVKKEFGTLSNPPKGATYLLPDGLFLNMRSRKLIDFMDTFKAHYGRRSGFPIHVDVDNYLSNELNLDVTRNILMTKYGCVRLNTLFDEIILELPEQKITSAQESSLIKWLDSITESNQIAVMVDGRNFFEHKTYSFDEYTSDDILKKIKRFYATGKLVESASTDVDSEGRKLSPEQIAYFKNSKARNEKGQLLVCYHGTTKPGFNEFDPKKGSSQFGEYKFKNYNVNYFTTNFDVAQSYTEVGVGDVKGERKNIYECYLNILNPYIVTTETEGEIATWRGLKDKNIRQKELKAFDKLYRKWYNSPYKIKDKLDELNRDLFSFNLILKPNEEDKQYFDLATKGDNSMFGSSTPLMYQYDTIEELFDDRERIQEVIIGEDEDDYYYTIDYIINWVLRMNEEDKTTYDGIIVPDISDIGPRGSALTIGKTTDIVTLKSANQIKNVYFKTPTASSNINEDEESTRRNPTESDVLDAVEKLSDKDDDSYADNDAIFNGSPVIMLTPSGTVLNASEYDTHGGFLDAVFENYLPDFYNEDDDYRESYDYCIDVLGFITLNTGTGYSDKRVKVVIMRKPTPAQESLLTEWLARRVDEGVDDMILFCAGHQRYYNLTEEDEKAIMKKIRRCFVTGFLESKNRKKK